LENAIHRGGSAENRPTDENVSRVSVRASVIASLFSFSCIAGMSSAVSAEGAVTLDFSPIGAHESSSARTSAAPADVNFGSYPLSVLGIDNAIRDANSRVDDYTRGERRCDDGPIAYSVIAIRDWEKRYPNDPWIAKDLLALAKFYARVGTRDSRSDERGVAEWLVHDYPSTAYASNANALIASLGASPARGIVAEKREIHETASLEKKPPTAPPSVALKVASEPTPVARPPIDVQEPSYRDPFASVYRRKPVVAATLPPYAHYESQSDTNGNGVP
jgi:hypothetical protein